jgi:hypothetical protein
MLTALLALILLAITVSGAEFVRHQCRRMLSTPLSTPPSRQAATQPPARQRL